MEQDFELIRACAGDAWHLCSDVLPDVGRFKSSVQEKIGQLPKGCLDKLLDSMAGGSFKVCKNQTYALCAAARCNVYDGVAYCQCDVKHGDSISPSFQMGKEDVCSTNAAGANNKYMISTYSLPESIASPQGGAAVYTCSGGGDSGAYAQCDGGICFRSTEETTFPGFDKPVPKGKSSAPAPLRRPVQAASRAIKSWGRIPATSPSSNSPQHASSARLEFACLQFCHHRRIPLINSRGCIYICAWCRFGHDRSLFPWTLALCTRSSGPALTQINR